MTNPIKLLGKEVGKNKEPNKKIKKKYICEYCGKSLSSEGGLTNHIRNYCDASQNPYFQERQREKEKREEKNNKLGEKIEELSTKNQELQAKIKIYKRRVRQEQKKIREKERKIAESLEEDDRRREETRKELMRLFDYARSGHRAYKKKGFKDASELRSEFMSLLYKL